MTKLYPLSDYLIRIVCILGYHTTEPMYVYNDNLGGGWMKQTAPSMEVRWVINQKIILSQCRFFINSQRNHIVLIHRVKKKNTPLNMNKEGYI
jgi:hypothetical protein